MIAESHPSRPTLHDGNPSDAKAKPAFFTMDNLQLELIQPLGEESFWHDFPDEHGEGIHHIAFKVKDIISFSLFPSSGWSQYSDYN